MHLTPRHKFFRRFCKRPIQHPKKNENETLKKYLRSVFFSTLWPHFRDFFFNFTEIAFSNSRRQPLANTWVHSYASEIWAIISMIYLLLNFYLVCKITTLCFMNDIWLKGRYWTFFAGRWMSLILLPQLYHDVEACDFLQNVN